MARHVCPWWLAYTFDNPLRKWLHKPEQMLASHVRPGMTVLDIGCGMGFFSIGMARLVGDGGTVIAVDLQQRMLDVLSRRAEKAGMAGRIRPHKCEPDRLGVRETVDFALAFWCVHEIPNTARVMGEIHAVLRTPGRLLVAEPFLHVCARDFRETVAIALDCGFGLCEHTHVRASRSALLEKREE